MLFILVERKKGKVSVTVEII